MGAVKDGPLRLATASIINCAGRGLHSGVALRALKIGLEMVDVGPSPRYASSCSGVDFFAVAIEQLFDQGWTYTQAAEWRPSVASALTQVYGHRGLKRKMVFKDARVSEITAGPSEIWSFSPPCEPFSKRNHNRSEDELVLAGQQVAEMLWYPRLWRPKLIFVENVDEVEAVAIITAALKSLKGYIWKMIVTEARDYTGMCRARRLWIGAFKGV